jgi:hypothetical protein
MQLFAIIEITERNLISILSVIDRPSERAKFVYACFVILPTEERHFFVGRNHKENSSRQHWEYQILAESELDKLYEYDKKKLEQVIDSNWFAGKQK